jgi:hypothetical protein
MNKIPSPRIDDAMALQAVSNNSKLGSYPDLQGVRAVIQQGYLQYVAARGNAHAVMPVLLSQQIGAHLESHYKSPPADLKHITDLRAETEHLACPMCGSSHRGTLDHLLPKGNYPAFAVFSLNLVPACKCNSKRKELLKGPNPGERILHPYFDDCLAERLIAAKFEKLGAIPDVRLQLCVDSTHPDYAAIDFHVRSIVQRTSIVNFLRDRWIEFCRKPSLIVRALKRNPQSAQALKLTLEEELALLDDLYRGKNTWYSIFVAGLLHPEVLLWIFSQMHSPGRAADGPLI